MFREKGAFGYNNVIVSTVVHLLSRQPRAYGAGRRLPFHRLV